MVAAQGELGHGMESGRYRVWSIVMIVVLLLGTSAITAGANNPNFSPVANADTYTATAGTPLIVAAPGVLGNDFGGPLTAIKVTDPAHGTLTLQADGSFTYTASLNFAGTDSFTYKANDGATDSAPATVTITVLPAPADLQVTMTVDNATPNNNDTITFTVTLKNAGPLNATGVQVTDRLPSGLNFSSATPSQSTTYDNNTGIWNVGALANQATAALVLKATVSAIASVANSASVTHSDMPDSVTTNNTASVTITPQVAELALLKTASKASPIVGDTEDYTVTLVNNGPNTATSVTVFDQLPTGVTFVSATPSQGTFNNSTHIWTVGTVTLATQPTLTISTSVTDASAVTNTASINHSDQTDPNTNDNFAIAGGNPNAADLVLLQTVDKPSPNPGDAITFTLTLRNSGPAAATTVKVTDQLPVAIPFVSATPSSGTSYDSGTGIWTVNSLANQATATLQIAATAPQNQTTNTATVSHSDQADPNSSNNNANVTVTPPGADLIVTQQASTATPAFGTNVTFTVTVTNNGPNDATNVQITDSVPGGTTFVSATPSKGSYVSGTGVWTVGGLASQATATLALVVTVATPSQIQNQAYVSRSDQYDPNGNNNSSTLLITPIQPVLSGMAISQSAACVNNGVQYTENVTSLSLTKGPASTTLTVNLNYSGGDSNAFTNPSVAGTFMTNGSGAGTFTGSINIPTTSAVATYPTSVFVTITTASSAQVASGSVTPTNGSGVTCTQPSTLVATVNQSAVCGDAGFQYIEGVTSLTLTGATPNTSMTVKLTYTGGNSTDFGSRTSTMGSFTTDAGGQGTFSSNSGSNNPVLFNGHSPSNYPTTVTVTVYNGATSVGTFDATVANGHLTGNVAAHC